MKMDGILEVAVVGVPDEVSGELPKAFVVKREGINMTEEQVCKFLEPHVAPFKHLKGGVQFLKQIPKNAAGKVLRKELQSL
jgi:4-coumarate--CoA ligase